MLTGNRQGEVSATTMIARTFGKYRIVEQIGRGGTGLVYKAVDETLCREVAIKVLHGDVAHPDIMRRFRAEATTLARLNHPDIATVYELLSADVGLLLVMEFVRGETLDRLATRLGPLPLEHAVYLIDRVLSALDYAHRVGVVHRDMKPANIMVTEEGSIKIMDFGTARVRGAEHMTVDGSLLGTPAYMAPEQVLGRDVDARTDVYAAGLIFYRLLTGALPFEADNAIAMMHRQVSEPPPQLRLRRHDAPQWCEEALNRALAKSPSDRYQSAEEFRRAIGEHVHQTTRYSAGALVGTAGGASTGRDAVAERTVVVPPPEQRHLSESLRVAVANIADRMPRSVRESSVARMLAVVAFVAAAGLVTYAGLRAGTNLWAAPSLPPVAFEATAVVDLAGTPRERGALIVLADGHITVSTLDGSGQALQSVPYSDVVSISYSRGRDPLWNSPDGPTRAVRVPTSGLGRLGIFVERHWVSVHADSDDQLLIFRTNDGEIKRVLAALEERTGHTPQRVARATNIN